MRTFRTGVAVTVAGALVLAGASVLAGAPAAQAGLPRAADTPVYSITLAARVCDEYTDVMANRARNNIQESLRDLGKDTVYSAGQPVSPAIEEPNQPACRPLDGWRFALGNGIAGAKVDHLSVVTNAAPATAQTSTVPLLDDQGQPTGDTIDGAVNVTLTAAQLQLAQQRNLWVQGGTPTDPLLNGAFPFTYGFAALRCAIDNLNGDNVEWVGYPSGVRHVFCYYYAVSPPPTAATIVVRKQLEGGTDGPGTFRYVGNISYTTDHDFTLTADVGTTAQQSFIRAAGDPWDFEEQPLAGWTQVSLACVPAAAATIVGAKATVVAAPGQTVTCTYVNRRNPTGTLQLDKVSLGGVGSFPFTVTVPPPGTPIVTTATTARTGVAVVVATSPGGTPGTYTATETLPADTAAGSWSLSKAECNGVDVTGSVVSSGRDRTLTRVVAVGAQALCTFTNTFDPDGAIVIRKTTTGGVGTFDYAVTRIDPPTGDDGLVGSQSATTSAEGVPVTAAGDPLTGLPVDDPDSGAATAQYQVTELMPPDTAAGSWRLTAASCTGSVLGSIEGQGVVVALSPGTPHVTCDFTNAFVPIATVGVQKVVTGPLSARTGPVVVRLQCADGTLATLSGPAGQPGPFALPDDYVFRDPTRCTVSETATGAAAGAVVTTTIAVSDDGVETTTDGHTVMFDVLAGHRYAVRVMDDYLAPLSPSGSATSSVLPTQTGQNGGGGSGGLPDTGAGAAGAWLLTGAVLVLAGLALLMVPRRRGSH